MINTRWFEDDNELTSSLLAVFKSHFFTVTEFGAFLILSF